MPILNTEKRKFELWRFYLEIGDAVYLNEEVAAFCLQRIIGKVPSESEVNQFTSEVDNLLDECKKEGSTDNEQVPVFYIPKKSKCRFCRTDLKTSSKITTKFFDDEHGMRDGWRFRLNCPNCNVTEYGTFYSKGNNRFLDVNTDDEKWFVSTEETVVSTSLLKRYEIELLYANLPFRCKSKIFSRLFGTNDGTKASTVDHKK